MSPSPRIEINLGVIRSNSEFLVRKLRQRNISVTGVTKGISGNPEIAMAMLQGGILQLADSRVSNVRRLREAGFNCPITMIRTPLTSEVSAVIKHCETSYHSNLQTIERLANVAAIKKQHHGIVLMLDMGDGREGIYPKELAETVAFLDNISGVYFNGIATNFGCLSGIGPSSEQMAQFSELVIRSEKKCGRTLKLHSSGGSANILWALSSESKCRATNLRIGEAILLGVDPISELPINGLNQHAISLFAEVIECTPVEVPPEESAANNETSSKLILAVGTIDTDVTGIKFQKDIEFIGATSDHLVVRSRNSAHRVGSEIKFSINYSALARAMAGPDVVQHVFNRN